VHNSVWHRKDCPFG